MSDTAKQNVVNLEDYAQTTRGMGSSACAQVLGAVRKLVENNLARNFSNMMGKIDDALFGRAEMAESNPLQAQYHHAMQTLRDIRKDVEEDFINHFKNRFDQGIPRQTQFGDSFILECDSAASVGVPLDKSSSEETRAIANMIFKAREDCAQLLPALDRRIGFLLHDPDLEQWQNPLNPEAICAAFQEAARVIETGLEIRLLIFKLFDQYVISNMDELYKELNQHLVKMGVMPDINIMLNNNVGPADSPQTPIARRMDRTGTGDDSAVAMLSPPADQQAGADRQASVQSGDMAIDIVAMLFDHILDNRNIPAPMRALLGRLQIPLVKVAMLEREFFSRKSHPARQLLNALVATAMGWDAQQGHEDPSYRKVEAIVQTIGNEFETDTSLFKTLLDDLEAFHDAEQQLAGIRAGHSVKVMQGQERVDAAKSVTMQEIEPRISDQKNLDFVSEFITTHWKNLLFITCARQGKDSDTWKQVVSTMDDLIWSVKPKNTDQERQRLLAMQPKLLNDLREGMERLSVPSTERDAFIARLVDAHGRTSADNENAEQAEKTRTRTAARNNEAAGITPAIRRARWRPQMPGREKRHRGELNDLYTTRVRQLGKGARVEFLASNGKATAAKLSWISPINNTYLFTDRQGLKVGSYTLEELAKLMRCGRAHIIN